jgi:hypothetical protein
MVSSTDNNTLRRRVLIGAVVVLSATAFVLVLMMFQNPSGRLAQEVEKTRIELRNKGFKTELSDFDMTEPKGRRAFQDALTTFSATYSQGKRIEFPAMMPSVGTNSTIVVWRMEQFRTDSGTKPWPEAVWNSPPGMESQTTELISLEKICTLLTGTERIRFNLDSSAGSSLLLPHLAQLRSLQQILGLQMLCDLHSGKSNEAWTNLLASTRLVTAWDVEPIDISQMVRLSLAHTDYNLTWQALQHKEWPEAKLAQLQLEWESLNFFTNLPEAANFAGTSAADFCRQDRLKPSSGASTLPQLLRMALRSPQNAWYSIKFNWNDSLYKNRDSYVDEKNLLLHYSERKAAITKAIESPVWEEMKKLPGITNSIEFQSRFSSRMQSMLNTRNIVGGMQRRPDGILGRVAESETRRRLLVTAIALERYRNEHGVYPSQLNELLPYFLKELPVSFTDGKPLRYQPTTDGRYWMYSPGTDGVDHGGSMFSTGQGTSESPVFDPSSAFRYGMTGSGDIIWSLPATAEEESQVMRIEKAARLTKLEHQQMRQDTEWWKNTRQRQSEVDRILRLGSMPQKTEPKFNGKPLSEMLRNITPSGTNKLTLNQMLVLNQVVTGEEPERITFLFPMKYEAVTNIARLDLFVDPTDANDNEVSSAALATRLECDTNGNCRLIWNTLFEPPGKHALQAAIIFETNPNENIVGPIAPFTVGNLCQFSASSMNFDKELGSPLHAKLQESNATYVIEIKSQRGEPLKVITGQTSDGFIRENWDLIQDNGKRFREDDFDTVFHVTLTGSGRTQTFRGP